MGMATLFRYSESKERLLATLDDFQRLLFQGENSRAVVSVQELSKKLSANRFYLVVLGQFKRGKTTFINSLLGAELLPTAVVPLTSVVTFIEYGNELSVTVFFQSAPPKKISVHELADYVTEPGNPENRKGVERVEITFPSPFLRDGVVLIDTPGIGSVYLHNTDTTYGFISKVDAGILIVSADPPITQLEYDFLKEVTRYVDRLFFVLNKIDYLSDREIREALDFTAEVLRKNLGNGNLQIFPLSAKLALEGKLHKDARRVRASQLPAFEERLKRFLHEEKGKTLLRSVGKGALRLLGETEFGLQLEMKGLITPLDELTAKLREFDQQLQSIQQDREDFGHLLKGELNKVKSTLQEALSMFEEDEIRRLKQQLRTFVESHPAMSNSELFAEAQSFLPQHLVADFDAWRADAEKRLSKDFERILGRFAEKTNAIIEHLVQVSSDIFGLQVRPFTEVEKLTPESRFYYKLDEDPVFFSVEVTALYQLLPKKWARRWLLKKLMTKIPERVGMNCGRVRYDFVERMDKSYRQFKVALDEKIENLISEIRGALERGMTEKSRSEREAQERLGGLNEALQRLEDTKGRLIEFAELDEVSAATQERGKGPGRLISRRRSKSVVVE